MHGKKSGTEINRYMLASNGGLLSKVYEHSEPTNVENLVNFQITSFYKKKIPCNVALASK
jgi:hypothetical protein